MERFAVSPCSNPELSLEQALRFYSAIGYRKFEAFSGWVQSSLDSRKDAQVYKEMAATCGIRFTSYHLPIITEDVEGSLKESVRAACFAEELGVKVALFKAQSRPLYIQAAKQFLNATAHLKLIPVLQNHAESPIATLADYEEVIRGINDPRMKTLLEVGHFHSVGVHWREGCRLLGDSIALVHIKDQIGALSVPLGTGEIDLPGLFHHLRSVGYKGDIVVEMEVEDRENTLKYLADARDYLQKYGNGGDGHE